MTKTIDMTPTDEGYVNIAMMFIQSIEKDVKQARKKDALFILGGVIRTVAYFASKNDTEKLNALLQYVEGKDFQPIEGKE